MKDLEKALKITEQCFVLAKRLIGFKLTEKYIADELTSYAMFLGADRLAFTPIISAGESASKIHPLPSHRKIKENEFVIVDFGVVCGKSRTDVTRTYCINPDRRKIKLYNLVKKAQKIAERKVKVGAKCSVADITARKYLKKHTKMKFPYAIGHGVGKRVHDKPKITPKSKYVFKTGNIFTLEPGLHSKREGLRIEDMYLLTGKGIKKLTKDIPGDLSG